MPHAFVPSLKPAGGVSPGGILRLAPVVLCSVTVANVYGEPLVGVRSRFKKLPQLPPGVPVRLNARVGTPCAAVGRVTGRRPCESSPVT